MSEQVLGQAGDRLKVVVYSHDRLVRQQVRLTLGRKVVADLPEVEIFEFATQPALLSALAEQVFDVAVLDGEARPGGMGLSHQIKDEIPAAPPVVLLIARLADAWLATWSRVEAVCAYPIDPIRLPAEVARVVRETRAGVPGELHACEVAPGVGSRHGADDGHGVPGAVGTAHGPRGGI